MKLNKKTDKISLKKAKDLNLKSKKREYLIAFAFIMIASIFAGIPLLKFNIQYDDGIQHICRLIGSMQSIEEKGLFFPVIMQNLCNGFGYSWNLFYSPLTAYLPLLFKIFSISYENCLKLFMFSTSIASGYAMYFFMKKILKEKEISDSRKNYIAILGAVFYILAPYRLTDMYIRVAVAELASFIFLPIVFNGLYSIIIRKEKGYILAFGASLILLTHTLITFYLAIICAIYVLINIKKIKKQEFLELIKNITLTLVLTAFFTVPLLESKLSCDYEVFKQSHMVREDALIECKVGIEELIFIKENRMAYFLGIPLIAGLILTVLMIKNKKIENKKSYYFFLVTGIVSAILTLKFIPFEKFPSFMKMMQFSFRLLEFSSFFLSVIASLNFGIVFKKFNIFAVIIISLLTLDLLIPIIKNIDFSDRYIDESRLIEGIAVTANTRRVHAGCASFEYLPSKAFENRKYIEDREDVPIVLDGDAVIKDFEKNGTNAKFKVEGSGKIELPYIYYVGYKAVTSDEQLKITESENGFLQIEIQGETEKEIKVSYEGSLAMKMSMAVSILGLIIIFVKKLTYHKSADII